MGEGGAFSISFNLIWKTTFTDEILEEKSIIRVVRRCDSEAEIRYPPGFRQIFFQTGINMAKKSVETSSAKGMDFSIGLPADAEGGKKEVITARKAGDLTDLDLSISPRTNKPAVALRNLAKSLNIALKVDFIETELDLVYKVARVRKGVVHVIHKDYIGLGDGLFASIGKTIRSIRLTLEGPDAASPEGEKRIKEKGESSFAGIINLIGRKLDFLQEFEDMVPFYVEQTLDRLEAKRIITDWNRNEWKIETTSIGLDILITPVLQDADDA